VDEDPDDPWCTLANVEGGTYSEFQCKAIKCTMERPLNTGDKLYDWAFLDFLDSGSTAYDKMIIMNKRAQLWISNDFSLAAPLSTKSVTGAPGATGVTWTQRYIEIDIVASGLFLTLGMWSILSGALLI
jgi:hypothetical protein